MLKERKRGRDKESSGTEYAEIKDGGEDKEDVFLWAVV
jgi:hypothetical protein